ncbi:MAG: hypothetical protein HFJ28_00920 [Clostridia bacterium]|jgi:Ca2+-binding EF-hand superfamily protein|nr:hypothetical protein [Clostridia bacterium]
MEFERTLKQRIYEQEVQNEKREYEWLISSKISSIYLQDTKFSSIQNAYAIFIEKKKRNLSKDELYQLYDEFEQALSAEALEELKKQIKLSRQEEEYIQYEILSGVYIEKRKKCFDRSTNKKNFIRKVARRNHYGNFESITRRSNCKQ